MAGKVILYAPNGCITDEKRANGVVTPGNILNLETNGRVGRHPVAGGNLAPRMIAIDMPMVGRNLDDDYPDGDQCIHVYPRSGEKFWALLEPGETVVIGDKLESAGNGNLQKHNETYQVDADAGEAVWGQAEEAIDNSAGADPVRVRVTAN